MNPTTEIARPNPISASPADMTSVRDWRGPDDLAASVAPEGAPAGTVSVAGAKEVAVAVGGATVGEEMSTPDGRTRTMGSPGGPPAACAPEVGVTTSIGAGAGVSVGRDSGRTGLGERSSTGT